MQAEFPRPLVSTQWLADNSGAPDLKIVDASFRMPGVTPTAREAYLAAHIPGSVFFDIEDICDREAELPHMLPSSETFAWRAGALGLSSNDRLVLYDSAGLIGAARVWWTFRAFGHNQVAVLDGGLPKWLREGRPADTAIPLVSPAEFKPRFDPSLVRAKTRILAGLTHGGEQIVDARAAPRFEGLAPEPRPGLRSGHIPGARNLDFTRLIDPASQTLRGEAELRLLFQAAGVALDRPIVTSCGSGVTACMLALALFQLGRSDVAVYDGSWAEWGAGTDLPIETGPAGTLN